MEKYRILRLRWITPIGWGILFCINMAFWLYLRSNSILFMSGFLLGGAIISAINTYFMNCQSKLIDRLFIHWENCIHIIEYLGRKNEVSKMRKRK